MVEKHSRQDHGCLGAHVTRAWSSTGFKSCAGLPSCWSPGATAHAQAAASRRCTEVGNVLFGQSRNVLLTGFSLEGRRRTTTDGASRPVLTATICRWNFFVWPSVLKAGRQDCHTRCSSVFHGLSNCLRRKGRNKSTARRNLEQGNASEVRVMRTAVVQIAVSIYSGPSGWSIPASFVR